MTIDTVVAVAADPTITQTREVRPLWQLLLKRPVVVVCVAILAIVIIPVALAQLVAPYSPLTQDLSHVLALPSAGHWLGTDDLGRDVLSRLLFGGQSTVLGILQALAVFLIAGAAGGLLAGMSRGWVDGFVSRVAEIVLSVPSFIIILVVLTILPGNMTTAMITIGLLTSPLLMRVVRGNTRVIRNELYVRSARAAGLTETQITIRHVLPRLAGPIIVQATIFCATVIMVETGLGYLGFGVQIPNPSWGNLVTTASENINRQPWLLIPTGGTIAIVVLCFTLIGDGLRDAVAERWTGTVPNASRKRRRAQSVLPADQPTSIDHAALVPSEQAVLRVRNLTVVTDTPHGTVTLVEGVSLDIAAGETLCLVGESGSGKSITALSILGLTRGPRIVCGDIWVGDSEISKLHGRELDAARSTKFGYITQDPQTSLDPSIRVGDLLAQLVRLHTGVGRSAARRRAIELIETVGIPSAASVARRYPHQLSGGMAQRIVIAAALSGNPDVLVADEPTTALDVTVQAEVLALLHRLCDGQSSMSLLLITHDWGVVADIADSVAVMYQGHIVERAEVHELFDNPQHPFTRKMLAAEPDHEPRRATTDTGVQSPLLEVAGLVVEYATRDQDGKRSILRAVDEVGFTVGAGRTLGLVGESGSGKSTTGNAIAGLVKATGGSIRFNGREITGLSAPEQRELSSEIQIIFQDPYGSLNPVKTIGATLEEPLVVARGMTRAAAAKRVRTTLERVGLDASAVKRYPAQFSGGQRQRIAIARALVLEPKLIICDEPVSALDLSIQAQILDLLSELQRELGVAYVFISHDLSVVRNFCDEISIMYRGKVVESGNTEVVCGDPQHPYTRALLAAAPIPDPVQQRGRSQLITRYAE